MSSYYVGEDGLSSWEVERQLQAFSRRMHAYAESPQSDKDYEEAVNRIWTEEPLILSTVPDDVLTDVRTTGLDDVQLSLFDAVA